MFSVYPHSLEQRPRAFDPGPFFCEECRRIVPVKTARFKVPKSSNDDVRVEISVLQCSLHDKEHVRKDYLTSLFRVVPKNGPGSTFEICSELEREYRRVKAWDIACCIFALLGSVLLILGVGVVVTLTFVPTVPSWLPGVIMICAGVLCLLFSIICIYKSGVGSGNWSKRMKDLLEASDTVSLGEEFGWNKYQLFLDNFCILKQ
ncbi:MAG: hypothetical protein RSB82_02075 [Victivallaceae bacterium]